MGLSVGPGGWGIASALIATRGKGEQMKVRRAAERFAAFDKRLRAELVDAIWAEGPGPAPPGERILADAAEAIDALLGGAGASREQVAAVGWLTPRWEEMGPALAGRLARRIAVRVAGGFARADRVAGGLGGNVIAWPTWLLARDRRLSRVVLHLGALASVVFVGSGAAPVDVAAGDVGPGTCLIDHLCRSLVEQETDTDGALAARGGVHSVLLNELLGHHWFSQPWPRVARPADWSETYRRRLELMAGKHGCHGVDLIATVTEMTARLVAQAVGRFTERPHQVILTGGGASNITLATRIRELLSPCSTISGEVADLPGRNFRGLCAAVLASACASQTAVYCPQATGADAPVTCGVLLEP